MSPIKVSVPATSDAIPHGRTARRLDWGLLPPYVRTLVEGAAGSPVVTAESAGAGYTPGFASTLVCEDGSRHFVKAASKKAQRPFAEAYREEVRTLRALPGGLPVPTLSWSHEDDLWVVLSLEHVPGANPARPWRSEQLDDCLDALEVLAARLSPPRMPLPSPPASLVDELAECLDCWDRFSRRTPGLAHLDEARALAAGYAVAVTGDTLVHTDVRDDNLILGPGGALLCDWSWPARGAAWVDTVMLLISAHGDGLDADAVLARRQLTRAVDPEHVDQLLALLAGFLLEQADQPVPNSSPWLRAHQRWYADATWAWLAARRGWS